MKKSMAPHKTGPEKKRAAYTVKQVAAMSGVSVRTLHFYDEAGLLKPAYHGANGYRYYEEPQLLTLQQILYHLHHDQDEWLYVIDGEVDFVIGKKRFRAAAGQSVFIPRKTPHGFSPVETARMIDVFQPAGAIEDFFRAISALKDLPTREGAINKTYTDQQIESLCRTFAAHAMDLLPPPDIPEKQPA